MADAGPSVILDLSRLLSRVMHVTPTGVDRCEMAYARELLAQVPAQLRFAAVHPVGGLYGRLSTDGVRRFLDATEERWAHQGALSRGRLRRDAARWLATLHPRPVPARRHGERRVFLQSSPNHLTDAAVNARILRRERARFAVLVHDLIPLQFPEYARPDGAAQHRARLNTMMQLADAIVTNSQATLDALAPFLPTAARSPRTAVAHLGTHLSAGSSAAPAPGRPFFVCIGTIEPRKNHLLLLNLWRRWSERDGAANVPRLLVIGRRGWENEQVIDMLERCPALQGCVEEQGGLPDRAVERLLAGARALLLPSFAEGYGMPVSEAQVLGVPVLASDLPALREAGGDVPDFLDPLDGPAWARAVEDLAGDVSAIAAAQARRRLGWRPHEWTQHLAIVLDLLHKLAP